MAGRAATLIVIGFCTIFVLAASAKQTSEVSADPRLKSAYRFERAGWVYTHLEGSPSEIGFQHGYLLAPEIAEGFKAVQVTQTHNTKRDWNFFRETAQNILWPHIEPEYRAELQGIADGLKARGGTLDLWDVVALNAMEEIADYYVPTLDKQEQRTANPNLKAPGNCSAFIATGTYTKDGRIVMGHNAWTD